MSPKAVEGRGPFEAWDEEGILRVVLCSAAEIDLSAMRALLRAVTTLDPFGGLPVVVEQEELVRMTPEARTFLARACRQEKRPVAFIAYDLPDRIQGEFFARFYRPHFPFRVFACVEDAYRWFQVFNGLVRAWG